MSNVPSIAISGMNAAALRLEVSARNVANVSSAGPLPSAGSAIVQNYPAAYTPQRVDQVETAGGGTRAIVVPVSPAATPAQDATAPYADSNGMVAAPNVDLAGEAVDQLLARYDFAFNAVVLRSYAQMMKSLLDITV
jgi:flagellar basal-body rod protein FlgC